MPTGRGWAIAGTGVALWATGRALGAGPVEQVGFALLVFVLLAVGVVRLGRHEITVTRRVTPNRARPHTPVTVTLEVTNSGRGPAPLLLIEDRLPPHVAGTARFSVAGIERRGRRETSFTIRARRRGRYDVGPLTISFVDPFGLARVQVEAAPPTSFLIYPAIEVLGVPRDQGDRSTATTSALKQLTAARGEDFYTLREYAEGDDLRKVHWPSTAKRGKYMIRQEETPWHARATLVLDDAARSHRGLGGNDSFERSVEAVASLVDLYHRTGYAYRVAASTGPGLPPGRGVDHYRRCLDLLATVTPSRKTSQDALAELLRGLETAPAAEASLVVVTGTMTAAAAAALAACRRRFHQMTMVAFPAHRFGGGTTRARWDGERDLVEIVEVLQRAGIRTLALGPGDALAPVWSSRSHGAAAERGARWAPKPELV